MLEQVDTTFVLQNLLSTIQEIVKQNSGVKIQDICFQDSIDLAQYTTPNNALPLRNFCEKIVKDIPRFKYCNGFYTKELLQELASIADSQQMFIDIGDIHSEKATLFDDPDIATSIIDQSLYIGNFSSEQSLPLNARNFFTEGQASEAQPQKKRGRFDLSDESPLHLGIPHSMNSVSTAKPDDSAAQSSESAEGVCNLQDKESLRDSHYKAFERAIQGLDADKTKEFKEQRKKLRNAMAAKTYQTKKRDELREKQELLQKETSEFNQKIMQLDAQNGSLKAENEQLRADNLQLLAENIQLKTEKLLGLLQKNTGLAQQNNAFMTQAEQVYSHQIGFFAQGADDGKPKEQQYGPARLPEL